MVTLSSTKVTMVLTAATGGVNLLCSLMISCICQYYMYSILGVGFAVVAVRAVVAMSAVVAVVAE